MWFLSLLIHLKTGLKALIHFFSQLRIMALEKQLYGKRNSDRGGYLQTKNQSWDLQDLSILWQMLTAKSTVYCLDTSKSGDIKWSTNIGSPINGNMIMDANQILYMVAGSSAITDFIGVDGKSGTILPRLNYAGTPNGDMAIATEGKIYYSAYHYTQERNYYHTIMAVSSDISQNTTTTIPGGTTTTTIPSETTTTTIPIDQSCEIISIDPTDVFDWFWSAAAHQEYYCYAEYGFNSSRHYRRRPGV